MGNELDAFLSMIVSNVEKYDEHPVFGFVIKRTANLSGDVAVAVSGYRKTSLLNGDDFMIMRTNVKEVVADVVFYRDRLILVDEADQEPVLVEFFALIRDIVKSAPDDWKR